MMLSIEAYVSLDGSPEGVKLEEQVLVTEDGYEIMSNAPYDHRLN